MSGPSVAPPLAGSVLLLEDIAGERELLADACAGREIRAVSDYKEFCEALESGEEFDLASLDWEIHGKEKGVEVLGQIADEHPDMAAVVYTKHERRRQKALQHGADECVIKPLSGDLTVFRELVERGLRLAHARKIAAQLRGHGVGAVPFFPRGQKLDDESERRLWQLATAEAAEQERRDEIDQRLCGLLIRRGWFGPRMDLRRFALAPWARKLADLFAVLDINDDQICRILQVDERVAQALRSGDPTKLSEESALSADQLLSVMAYALRLADYRPPVATSLWQVTRMFEDSKEPPPWDMMGFAEFLVRNGVLGVRQSLNWIRSH